MGLTSINFTRNAGARAQEAEVAADVWQVGLAAEVGQPCLCFPLNAATGAGLLPHRRQARDLAPPAPTTSAAAAPALINPPRRIGRRSMRSSIYVVASFADQRTWRRRPLPLVRLTAITSPDATTTVCVPSRHELPPDAIVQVTLEATPFTSRVNTTEPAAGAVRWPRKPDSVPAAGSSRRRRPRSRRGWPHRPGRCNLDVSPGSTNVTTPAITVGPARRSRRSPRTPCAPVGTLVPGRAFGAPFVLVRPIRAVRARRARGSPFAPVGPLAPVGPTPDARSRALGAGRALRARRTLRSGRTRRAFRASRGTIAPAVPFEHRRARRPGSQPSPPPVVPFCPRKALRPCSDRGCPERPSWFQLTWSSWCLHDSTRLHVDHSAARWILLVTARDHTARGARNRRDRSSDAPGDDRGQRRSPATAVESLKGEDPALVVPSRSASAPVPPLNG